LARPEVAPLFRDILDEAPAGRAFFVHTSDGKRLRAAVFPGGRRGSVLFLPGRTEFIEKFDGVIARLHASGFAVAIHDWRGQGLSDRPFGTTDLGHVLHYDEYQRDLAALRASAQWQRLKPPFLIFSHSMGGLLALRALVDGLPVRGAVFSAPMWGFDVAPWMRPPAWILTQAARLFGFGHLHAPGGDRQFYPLRQGYEGNLLTSDRAAFDHYCDQLRRHPELGLGGASLRWMRESMDEMARMRHAILPPLASLILMAEGEGIVSNTAIRQFAGAWPGAELMTIPGSRHEGWFETPEIRAMIWARIDAFLERIGV
jgi:lysophospholipase